MKTTLDIDDHLLAEAKSFAALRRTSLTRLIEQGLHLQLNSAAMAGTGKEIVLPVLGGHGGLVAGIQPTSNKALLHALGDDA